MADSEAIIGQATIIRGNVRGDGDLTVAGRIEGTIEVQGEVVFEETSVIQSEVSADQIVVRGALAGDLHATEAIILEAGSRVVGDIDAPRIRIEEGAMFRGRIEMGDGQQKPAPARKPAVQTRPAPRATTAPRVVARPRVQDAVQEADEVEDDIEEVPPPSPPTPKIRHNRPKMAMTSTGEDQPPPPVVPALKKKSKGAVRKRSTHS